MGQIEKTVFISYRRTNLPWALNIYQNLTAHGYDVFFDYESVNSGDFAQVILSNIRARAHFLVVLTPSMLERINEPHDWVRREIETAIDEERNIVPLLFEGFNFSDKYTSDKLIGKLTQLKKFAGLDVPANYFNEAMERLRIRYLNIPLDFVKQPVSTSVQVVVQKQQFAASNAAPVQKNELTAQEWYENAHKNWLDKNYDETIRCATNAIRLQPNFAEAYNRRGAAKCDNGDLDGGINDFTEAITFMPDFAAAYYNRSLARNAKGDVDGSIKDCTEAILFNPTDPDFYYQRGIAYYAKGDSDSAIKDCTEAIRLKPDYFKAYYCRGLSRFNKRDFDDAIKDFTEVIRVNPGYKNAYWGRGSAWFEKEDYYSAVADYQHYFDVGGTDEKVREHLDHAKKKIRNPR